MNYVTVSHSNITLLLVDKCGTDTEQYIELIEFTHAEYGRLVITVYCFRVLLGRGGDGVGYAEISMLLKCCFFRNVIEQHSNYKIMCGC